MENKPLITQMSMCKKYTCIKKDSNSTDVFFLRCTDGCSAGGERSDTSGNQRDSVGQLTLFGNVSFVVKKKKIQKHSRVALARVDDVVCFNICAHILRQ